MTTQLCPFVLSQPRPKLPPQPEPPPPPLARARPPPPHRAGLTREEAALAAAKAARHTALAAERAVDRSFRLRTLERPARTEALRAERDAALAAELAVRPVVRPPPPPPVAEVRLTAAAILREDALYKRKQAAEACALQRFAAELRDTAEFDR